MINDEEPTKFALLVAFVIYLIVLTLTLGLAAMLSNNDNPIQFLFTFK